MAESQKKLTPAVYVDLGENVRDMEFHCGFRNIENAADLFVGESAQNQAEDFLFPFGNAAGQLLLRYIGRQRGHGREIMIRGLGMKNALDRGHQIFTKIDVFHEAMCSFGTRLQPGLELLAADEKQSRFGKKGLQYPYIRPERISYLRFIHDQDTFLPCENVIHAGQAMNDLKGNGGIRRQQLS